MADLPLTVGGVTSVDENGDYNVYINSKCGWNRQKQAYKHEMAHISRNDFYSDEPIDEVESEV